MNERIQELAEQADNWAGTEFHRLFLNNINPNMKELFEEKFAELIVQECLNQCYNRGMDDELYAGQLKAATYIEEYFGVEE